MKALLVCPRAHAARWLEALRAAGPEIAFVGEAEGYDPADIDAAVVWSPPAGLLQGLPRLQCICVLGAGVDAVLESSEPLPDVPLIRLIDPAMAERMAFYILAAVLHWQRDLHVYAAQQRAGVWQKHEHRDPAETRVGIMGLGAMGCAAASLIAGLGYRTSGWSRSAKTLDGVRTFAGEGERAAFLSALDYLVCLLPLSPATRGILNGATFAALPPGAVVINAARGRHLVEGDLLAALASGRLRGAVLDVFADEPLPAEHPFWRHPSILVTPHVASLTPVRTAAPLVVESLRAVRDGRPLSGLVDRARGY